MRNLIDIKNLTTDEIIEITDLAEKFEQGQAKSTCNGKNLALLFCENSTRTRFSFEMAANKLGIFTYNFDAGKSSFSKGETLKDTIENLYAIGMDGIVIRHSEGGTTRQMSEEVSSPISFINAGEGDSAHPTQALLDFYTMKKHLCNVEGMKIAIVGDIKHSRVAASNIELLKRFGADIWLCAPEYFSKETEGTTFTDSLEEALKDADVAMFLRIQNERLEDKVPIFEYVDKYGLTLEKFKKFARKDTLIMHPGPVNRNVELSSEIVDGELGKTILEQAHNGVFVRMAVLELLFADCSRKAVTALQAQGGN